MSFNDKVVIVTGASSGIGAATAVELTKEGAIVVIVARNQVKLDRVSADCERAGKKPLIITANLVKDVDVKRIIDTTIEKFGKLDVLVNNAGYGGKFSIEGEGALKAFDQILALNLRAVVHVSHLAVPHLIKTKGNIVNVSSICATKNYTDQWAYCTAKAGVDHFSKCLAAELAPKGIRVNTVNPGPVKTDFFENMGLDSEAVEKLVPYMENLSPLKRVSEPQEISDVIMFLASEKARGVTGASWVSDNGYLLI